MTKFEAIKGTRKCWEKFNPKYRRGYKFLSCSCLLCKECNYCSDCVWCKAYGGGVDDSLYKCATWIWAFKGAETEEEASLIKDAIIGMLLVLEGEYKNE